MPKKSKTTYILMMQNVPLSSKTYEVRKLSDPLETQEIKANNNESVQKAIYRVEKAMLDGNVPQCLIYGPGVRSSFVIFCQN